MSGFVREKAENRQIKAKTDRKVAEMFLRTLRDAIEEEKGEFNMRKLSKDYLNSYAKKKQCKKDLRKNCLTKRRKKITL